MTWLLLWTNWHLKEDIKHRLSMSWWKRFPDKTARWVWGNRTSISSCLGGALKNTQRAGRFVPQKPQWHSNKTISKPINHRCGMQRKTNTKTWNGFSAAVSCFKGKTLQHFRLFLPDVFLLLSLFIKNVDDKKEQRGCVEMRSKRGQELICWIANRPLSIIIIIIIIIISRVMSHIRPRITPSMKNLRTHSHTHTRVSQCHSMYAYKWVTKYNMMNFPWQTKLVLLLWAICITQTNPLPHIPSCLLPLSPPHRHTHMHKHATS